MYHTVSLWPQETVAEEGRSNRGRSRECEGTDHTAGIWTTALPRGSSWGKGTVREMVGGSMVKQGNIKV